MFAIGCLLVAAPSHADHSSVHATASGDVATSDNVFSSADDRQVDMFFQVRPGLLYAYDAPRMIHELSGEVEVLEYLLHSTKPSINERASWKAFFTPGPRSEITLTANGGTGQLNAVSSNTSPEQTTIGVTPLGRIDLRQADAGEYFSWVTSKETRASQTGFARWTATEDNAALRTTTEAFEAGGALAFERNFQKNTISLEAGASVLRLERVSELPPGPMGSRLDRQINPRASLVWRHDIDKLWSTNLDAGLVYVNPIGKDPYPGHEMESRKAAPFPIFGGLVAYSDVWGRATVNVRRAVSPNLLVAQNTLNDSATAQLALPLPWLDDNPHLRNPKLVGLGSFGVERTQLIDPTTGTLIGSFQLARADFGVAWTARPGQTYGLRYEFMYQHGDAAARLVTPSFYRNTLFFTFSLRYPDRTAAQVPRRTQSVRSDRKDLAPVGAEPVVPDPTEQTPEE